ncbi:kinase-like protein [Rhizophagus irregularis]|uniref:Kinase-like protein n=1 Tax=Rhizophagus irregularis TaxID=588596 RepID=A0A2N0QZG8_9GLOM|nr:kinase-like protein [Rhizophagus irregularis]
MLAIRNYLVNATVKKAYVLTNKNIRENIDEYYESLQQSIHADKSLTNDEKIKAEKILNKNYDSDKINYNNGKKRICEYCIKECLAKFFCEIKIIEWIPYNNLQNIKYLTSGGFSKIYIADWIGGGYDNWDGEKQQLTRNGTIKVILKILENIKNESWFYEIKSHISIANKSTFIAQCHGITQDPSNGNFILVIKKLDTDLRKYLQANHSKLTWKERTKIAYNIIDALHRIQNENEIHRDLHSGNVLYYQRTNSWFISDFGLCGPVDKQLGNIYGNFPYIAPEIFEGKGYDFSSDIYSIGMLMWEISSGKSPFTKERDKELMEQCWDADPTKRPNINTLFNKIKHIYKSYFQNENDVEQQTNNVTTINNAQLCTSSSVSHSFSNSIYRNSSNEVYNLRDLLSQENSTKDYYSIQFDYDLRDGSITW